MYKNQPSCKSLQGNLRAHSVSSTMLVQELGLTPSPALSSYFYTCGCCFSLLKVCLNEMRGHLKTCEKYIEKYGPVQELGDAPRYSCPYCQCEVDEDELMDCSLTCHRLERRAVIDISTVGKILVQRVLDGLFLDYVHVSHPNSM
ncbi:unnamed protein product [Bubo scandiacus]